MSWAIWLRLTGLLDAAAVAVAAVVAVAAPVPLAVTAPPLKGETRSANRPPQPLTPLLPGALLPGEAAAIDWDVRRALIAESCFAQKLALLIIIAVVIPVLSIKSGI